MNSTDDVGVVLPPKTKRHFCTLVGVHEVWSSSDFRCFRCFLTPAEDFHQYSVFGGTTRTI